MVAEKGALDVTSQLCGFLGPREVMSLALSPTVDGLQTWDLAVALSSESWNVALWHVAVSVCITVLPAFRVCTAYLRSKEVRLMCVGWGCVHVCMSMCACEGGQRIRTSAAA